MGRRRRRKIIRVERRRIPKIFICPICGERAVTVKIGENADTAHVSCGACGISGDVPAFKGMAAVDAYCTWYDEVVSKGLKAPIELR